MHAQHPNLLRLLGTLASLFATAPAWSQPAVQTPRPVVPAIDTARRIITMDEGISLSVPKTWNIVPGRYRNAVELTTADTRGEPDSRTIVTLERRLDHADAVGRLDVLASRRGATVRVLAVAGWPAVNLRYSEPLPVMERRGEPGDRGTQGENDENQIALHTVTAVAVADNVLVVHTTVAPGGSDKRAGEAEDMARKVSLPARSDARNTPVEVKTLTTALAARQAGPPKNDPPGQPPAVADLRNKPELRLLKPRLWDTGSSTAVAIGGVSSETSAGVSNGGQNMIISSNGGTTISSNSGTTFTATAAALPFGSRGDPSIAVGHSGNFYLSQIGIPATGAVVTGCAVSVLSSGNAGAVFAFAGNAALCPATGGGICFTDQPHIAADRTNASPGNGDQLYAVWRNFTPFLSSPANCVALSTGSQVPSISCSTDSASNWSTPAALSGNDYPRLTVGRDGFVYVVIRDGGDVFINKFTSCSNGLVELSGYPRRVISGISNPSCPLPGIDRCDWGLTIPTVAVDDTNAAHVYVAVANPTLGNPNNEDILVIDSSDGGLTWGSPVAVNGAVTARRFMPWVCASAGNAYVGWYDRRAATAAGVTNDLTDYFLGSATTRNGRLVGDGERNFTGAADAQCASGWPGAPRNKDDAEKCTIQPQLAGVCLNGAGAGSGTPCDFSSGPACPSGESCTTGVGGPKYGDYNGIACNADRVLLTWASATPPAGFPTVPPAGINVFADVARVNGNLTIVERSIPANDMGRFNVLIDGGVVASSVAQTSAGSFTLPVTSPHRIGQTAAAGTSLATYEGSIDGDCDADGTVHFSALHPASCRITNLNRDYSSCTNSCSVAEGECMRGTHTSGERQGCIRDRNECTSGCSQVSLTVTNSLVPSLDTGKFNLLIDGAIQQAAVGNGGSTPAVSLAPGPHTVSETAAAGTSLANYTTTIGGDCGPTGDIVLSPGRAKTCAITNTRKPGTGADATLTVKSVLSPATDPGRFDLRIDGAVRAAGVGNGGTTNAVTLLAGPHTIDEVASGTTLLSKYVRTTGGDCDARGAITLLPGDNKTCTITNQKDTSACETSCSVAEGACMRGTHSSSERQECIRERAECVRACKAN